MSNSCGRLLGKIIKERNKLEMNKIQQKTLFFLHSQISFYCARLFFTAF